MSKKSLPEKLNICLVGRRIRIRSRLTDLGFLWLVARGLSRLGHKVTILSDHSSMNKYEVSREGVQAYYLGDEGSPFKSLKLSDSAHRKFVQLHLESKFDIVHSIDASGYKIGRHKKNLKVAVAYDVEATQMSQLFSIMGMPQESLKDLITTWIALVYKFSTTYLSTDRNLLNTADGIFVTSPQQRVILERYYLYPDENVFTVPYGMELTDLREKNESFEFRKKLNIPETGNIIVTFSDFTETRDLGYILKAFEKVVLKKPNTYLIIVGNGPQFKDVEFQMLNLALGSKVMMPGSVSEDEVLNYVLLADVYVDLSSKTSGFAPTMLEAMAQKKVIIGSEMSPISYVIEDARDGFLIRPADRDSLSQLLIEIFSGHIETLEIGEKARAKVLDLFDLNRMVESTVSAYKKILAHNLR